MTKKTGYSIIEHIDEKKDDKFIWPITRDLFYEAAIHRALLINKKGGPDIPKGLTDSTSDGYVRLERGNYLLAKVKGSEEQCKENLIAAFEELVKSDESVQVFETYNQLKTITAKIRKAVEEISLLGIMPGACRVCSRLGV